MACSSSAAAAIGTVAGVPKQHRWAWRGHFDATGTTLHSMWGVEIDVRNCNRS